MNQELNNNPLLTECYRFCIASPPLEGAGGGLKSTS